MNIEKSVRRIAWRLSNGWKANQNDIDAVNEIIEFVNAKQKEQIKDNQLFAKMYIHIYGEYLKFYKATVFDEIPQKELHKILDTPLSEIIENFKKDLNDSERYEIMKSLGMEDKHPATRTDQEKQKEKEITEQILEKHSHDEIFFNDIWDYKTVEKNLIIQINAVLNSFK